VNQDVMNQINKPTLRSDPVFRFVRIKEKPH
jgi:hypothetical protein